ncbi:glycosyltransferase [Bacillus cereus]|uniref:glycosyltransferase n=1 Tax=Bacillus cereus TaxID=1396 RepID=UPI00356C5AB7
MRDYQIVWRGPVLDATGYGTASREYALALERQGVDVKIETYTWGFSFIGAERYEEKRLRYLIKKAYARNKQRILIYHAPPGNIETKGERKKFDYSILNTVWETPKIPNSWLPIINKFDAVCVPCSQNMEAMINSGVNIPVFLVPHGADTNKYKPENEKLLLEEAKGKFIFVSVFDFQHRKNPETLLKAYWKEFTSDDHVALVIKTYGDTGERIKNKIFEYKKKLGFGDETASLFIMTGILGEKQFRGIYTLGNAFVLPTRGEGVGLPFIEALSSGIPVIATGWGGQMDFLNEKNSFLIDYKLSYPGISMNDENTIATLYRDLFEAEGQIWAEADINDLQKQMRYAYENPDLCQQKGYQGRKDMLQLSWDKAGIALKQSIEKIIG